MDTLHVARFRARYRVPAGDGSARARLDALLRDVLDQALETALAAEGVSAREEVCVRTVAAPARLRLDRPDAAVTAAWSTALAGAIRTTIDAGGDGVARYASRAHALVDVVVSVARGDHRRAWAWRQLGLWSAGDAPSTSVAADEAARVLADNAELAVATLAAAGRSGALAVLAARVPPSAWRAVAAAALRAFAVPPSISAQLLSADDDGAASTVRLSSQPPSGDPRAAGEGDARSADRLPKTWGAADARLIDRIARRSSLYAAAVAAPDDARRALAILAVLEAEPAALARSSASALVTAVADEAAADAGARPPSTGAAGGKRTKETYTADSPPSARRPSSAGRTSALEASSASAAAGSARGDATREDRSTESIHRVGSTESPRSTGSAGDGRASTESGESASSGSTEAIDRDGSAGSASLESARTGGRESIESGEALDDRSRGGEAGEMERGPSAENAVEAGAETDAWDDGPVPVTSTGETRWGGLLFLLHLVAELGIPREIVDSALFAARPLRWVLHRVATALLALDDADAAALAFAGLGPAADPPARGEPPASDEEEAEVRALAARIAAALHERITGQPAADVRAAAAKVREAARRDAVISADPGWIDVILRMDQVDTAVRRAGLDLDPGWLAWLGVVVRFVYE